MMGNYLFVAESNECENAEYAIGNSFSQLIEAEDIEQAIEIFRHEHEQREDTAKYGEPPHNPYNVDYTSSITDLIIYCDVSPGVVIDVDMWSEQIETEKKTIIDRDIKEKELAQLEELKAKYEP